MFSSSLSLPSLHSESEYYFVPEDQFQKGFLSFYSSELLTVNKTVRQRPESGKVWVYPRTVLDSVNPSVDFNAKIVLKVGNSSHSFGIVPLHRILNKSTYSSKENLTHAFLTCGQECITILDKFCIIKQGVFVEKFVDEEIISKLLASIHKVIHLRGSHSDSFKIESKEHNTSLEVSISLAKSLSTILDGPTVGAITIPEEKKEESVLKSE